MGWKPKIWTALGLPAPPKGLGPSSFLKTTRIQPSACLFRGLSAEPIRGRSDAERAYCAEKSFDRLYSAANASNDFGLAADIMKSEMRGTISDLKREPLNTP